MKDEIASAVFFITKLVRKKEKLSKHKLDKFAAKLSAILFEKYKNHWYPENPCRGHAFRCIRVNRQAREPLLEQLVLRAVVELTELSLPEELTLWVDPFEVSSGPAHSVQIKSEWALTTQCLVFIHPNCSRQAQTNQELGVYYLPNLSEPRPSFTKCSFLSEARIGRTTHAATV
uniref:Anti-proliferative protein domain-containing protein n=1 Tax=Malurus cyaneus samueli TaxID=2593467 RepID=A0A8C5UDT1_9PASS